jgi:thiamine kinase-like enzyme
VGQAAVRQALDFVLEINRARGERDSATIPPGSEACFSGHEHLDCIERRVQRLDQILVDTEIDRDAAAFVQSALRPAWEEIKAAIGRHFDLTRPLPLEERLVSPSDFGFHNALQGAHERLRFIDFEYAGWDDPAKLICDFFCQPQLPAALEFWEQFVGGLTQGLGLEATLPNRARRLLPAYRIKWCCIMLNDFARGDGARRDFAKGTASNLERKTAQLAKVRQALEEVLRA